ncbi:MAG: hypothetical protein P4L79_10200 [Legionella sp.]|uniref:hypothetical protein n=1 Tax=Legionella sp. TaxID=459 RepID=UPI00283DDDE3|nr:hypothetical protein [Legionella sp.]
MHVATRQKIEKAIAKKIVESALILGYSISIDNGSDFDEELELENSTNQKEVEKHLFLTDQDTVYFYKEGKCFGAVFLVYGNTGYDVIADYSDNDTAKLILKEAEELAKFYEEDYG